MQTWPSTKLPDLSEAQYAGDENPMVLRTPMDSGHIRQVRRFTASLRKMKVLWKMTQTQFKIFQAWHKYKISAGADFFYMDVPLALDTSLTQATVRFAGGLYEFMLQDDLWLVTATLEIENPVTIDESTLNTLLSS